jgi:hypothetical protein
MKAKKQLANDIIHSLKTEVDKWEFGNWTADNVTWGIEIWTANLPVFHTNLYKPAKVGFSLRDKFRIYMALSECRALKAISLKNNRKTKNGDSLNVIDEKIAELSDITKKILFIEHYSHTGCDMWKIINEYTHFGEEKIVLSPAKDGIEKALDMAIEAIDKRKKAFKLIN